MGSTADRRRQGRLGRTRHGAGRRNAGSAELNLTIAPPTGDWRAWGSCDAVTPAVVMVLDGAWQAVAGGGPAAQNPCCPASGIFALACEDHDSDSAETAAMHHLPHMPKVVR